MVLAVLIAICAIVIVVSIPVTLASIRAADELSDRLAAEALAKPVKRAVTGSCWNDPVDPWCYCGDCGPEPLAHVIARAESIERERHAVRDGDIPF